MSQMHKPQGNIEPHGDAGSDEKAGRSDEHAKQVTPMLINPADAMTRDTVLADCVRKMWTPDSNSLLDFNGTAPSHGVEEFRALRSRLYQLQAKAQLKSILVGSALPGEGRTFVAANLALALALQPECRVLLIDADLRNPRLHSALGTVRAPGFSEYLLQEVEEFGIMQKGTPDNLFFIPAGRPIAGPTELVANGRLKFLMDRVEPLFDWIIVDSPPAVPVSDACLLANYCDGVLMVVRSDSTPFDIVRKARDRFPEESLVGVVLNVIESDRTPNATSSGANDGLQIRG